MYTNIAGAQRCIKIKFILFKEESFMKIQSIIVALLGIFILIGCPSETTELTDAELVAAAKAALAITYGGSDDASNVTQDVTLPTTVDTASGVSITWSSDNTAIVSAAGAVTRPANGDGNASVTLTAAIQKGNESDSKTFSLTVLEEGATPTDAELVATAKADLAITYVGSDNAASVTQDITLPATVDTAPGVSITWSSDNTAVITDAGAVTRPASGADNASVTLTAAIQKGSESDSKTFSLTVLAEGATPPTDAELVATAKADLAITYVGSDNAASVTQDITLPATVATAPGVSIAWSSDNTAVITDAGAVTRPASSAADAAVKLTATITKGLENDTKEFSLTVLKEETTGPTDAQLVATAKAALAITYGSGDSSIGVTQDLSLPTTVTTAPGVTITWSSDNTAIITDAGAVTRPANGSGNAAVVLTATISKESETDTKVFSLTVLEEGAAGPTDAQLVAAAKTALAITYNGGDSEASVTQDVTLPAAGDGGTTITWSSDNTAVITAAGAVTRPSASSSDAAVTLTATISKGSESDTKVFSLTVLKEEPTDIGTLTSFTIDVDDATVEAGIADTHSVTVNGGGLTAGTDYTLSITPSLTITDAGAITIPANAYSAAGTPTITVTATGIGNYAGTKEATFTLTVVLSDADAVAAAKTALDITDITFASGEDKDSVTQDVTLPTSGDEGTAIAWSSDNTAIDAATGAVTRPSASSSDATVTLTATISKGSESDTKVFSLTVLQEEPTDIGTLTSFTIDVDDATVEAGIADTHSVTVNGGGLTAGTDYTLSITDPLTITNAGAITIPANAYSAAGTPTITVTATGGGNYAGTKTEPSS